MYPIQHLYLTWGGPSCQDGESWQSGLRFPVPTYPGSTQLEDVDLAIYTWLSDPQTACSGLFRHAWTKLAVIGTDGRYPDDVDALLYEKTPGTVGSGNGHPPQCSVAVTTLTERTRGRGVRGRMYLPGNNSTIADDGRISVTAATNIATRTAQFIDEVTDLMGVPAAVFSEVGAGAYNPIVAVGVGRVVDTQRRRRRSLVEDRQEALVNP